MNEGKRRCSLPAPSAASVLTQVAARKQEIEDRLSSWIVFNEKNKELCAWLVQMENKVLQTADISIEEMIEKLQKVRGGVLVDVVMGSVNFHSLVPGSKRDNVTGISSNT